jgi:hypothetical protein
LRGQGKFPWLEIDGVPQKTNSLGKVPAPVARAAVPAGSRVTKGKLSERFDLDPRQVALTEFEQGGVPVELQIGPQVRAVRAATLVG